MLVEGWCPSHLLVLDEVVQVSRERQNAAIACHRSQSTDNLVLRRRLALLGDTEHLRVLYRPEP